jgi:hypothetical protein
MNFDNSILKLAEGSGACAVNIFHIIHRIDSPRIRGVWSSKSCEVCSHTRFGGLTA